MVFAVSGGVAALAAGAPPAGELRVGRAKVDLTPPVGAVMGNSYGITVSKGVTTPIHAKAVVFATPEGRAAIVGYPGDSFVELGLAMKQNSPFALKGRWIFRGVAGWGRRSSGPGRHYRAGEPRKPRSASHSWKRSIQAAAGPRLVGRTPKP